MTAFFADPIAREHDLGPGHPERVARFDAALRGLSDFPMQAVSGREATHQELALCHDPAYIHLAQREIESGRDELSTGDTQVCPRSFVVAQRAAGLALTAVDAVMAGVARNAFCGVRPPGHHACPARGMGFCIFNNVAVAARYAQTRYGLSRVLIADWDVHHGNGTQDIFWEDGSVFFFSTHQWPLYPGTGAASEKGDGAGRGTTLNCPLPAGSGRDEILGAFERQLAPAMDEFRPELVIVSAGFDSRRDDLLGQFLLDDEDFADLTACLARIAGRYASGRLVSVLEGGYNLDGLTSAVRSHAAALQRASETV